MRVCVLGTGAWGTVLAQVLADAGHHVIMWGRNAAVVEEIHSRHSNEHFLPGSALPHSLNATTDIELALTAVDAAVIAIPAQTLRENLRNWKHYLSSDLPLISTLKGIEAQSYSRMTEIIAEELEISLDRVGLLTGPNLAAELIVRQPAGAVGASPSRSMQDLMIELFTTEYFRIYPSDDLVGCELAGATKSIIALAVGMAIGLGYGENTQAMIITRGLGEVARFGAAYGANPLTNLGLAGMGDLIASCGSPLSRNRTFGEVLGRTGSLEAARLEAGKTVEGVASAAAILELAHQVGVVVPIIEVVSDVVQNGLTPNEGMKRLMTISLAAELQ